MLWNSVLYPSGTLRAGQLELTDFAPVGRSFPLDALLLLHGLELDADLEPRLADFWRQDCR